MSKNTTTGASTIWVYRFEDDLEYNQAPGDAADNTSKTFGANVDADSEDRENNPERMFRPFSRSAETILEMQFDGSWGATFTMTNTWWLQFIFGKPNINSDTIPPTHEYRLERTTPPRTAHLIEETHFPNGDISQTVYTGCFASSVDVEVSVEDTVEISLDGTYADEEFYENASASPYGVVGSQEKIEYRPLHFGNADLSIDFDGSGTADRVALAQDASVSLEGNAEGERELGTRFIAAPSFLAFEPDLSYTRLVDNDNPYEEQRAAYGDVATSTSPEETMAAGNDLEAVLTYGGSDHSNFGGGTQDMTIRLDGAFPDSYSRNNIGSPEDPLEDDIDRMSLDAAIDVVSDQDPPGLQ